jgi:transporter family protein
MWLLFAIGSAVFAALTSILAKVGIDNVNSNLATAIRTMVVLGMAWLMVFITNTGSGIKDIDKKKLDLSDIVRSCHRGFLALLLQSPAAWKGLRGGSG